MQVICNGIHYVRHGDLEFGRLRGADFAGSSQAKNCSISSSLRPPPEPDLAHGALVAHQNPIGMALADGDLVDRNGPGSHVGGLGQDGLHVLLQSLLAPKPVSGRSPGPDVDPSPTMRSSCDPIVAVKVFSGIVPGFVLLVLLTLPESPSGAEGRWLPAHSAGVAMKGMGGGRRSRIGAYLPRGGLIRSHSTCWARPSRRDTRGE
jgi:hypothetical protein